MFRITAFFLALVAVATGELHAQSRQLSLEVKPAHGTLGYGWKRTANRVLGVELGLGIPLLDRTLAPADESIGDFMHVGAFLRKQSSSAVLDGRVQAGMAFLNTCSGCAPGIFGAFSGGAFWGGSHAKIGARVTAGVIKEQAVPPTFVLSLAPVAALFTLPF